MLGWLLAPLYMWFCIVDDVMHRVVACRVCLLYLCLYTYMYKGIYTRTHHLIQQPVGLLQQEGDEADVFLVGWQVDVTDDEEGGRLRVRFVIHICIRECVWMWMCMGGHVCMIHGVSVSECACIHTHPTNTNTHIPL